MAPARPSAPIAVLASNINWNAYNNFGGRSNYISADELPRTPTGKLVKRHLRDKYWPKTVKA